MKTIHDMDAKAAAIKSTVQLLEQARGFSADYITHWTERRVAAFAQAANRCWRTQETLRKAKMEQRAQRQKIQELEAQIGQVDLLRQQLHQQIVTLEAQRQGIAALRDKDLLQSEIRTCEMRLRDFARPVVQEAQQLHGNLEAATELIQLLAKTSVGAELPALEQRDFFQQTRQVAQNRAAGELDVQQLLNQDWIDTSRLEEKIQSIALWQNEQNRWSGFFSAPDATAGSLLEQIYVLAARRNETWQRLQGEVRKKIREVELLQAQQVDYPPFVHQALKAIREQCPAADPKVLCDYVEVVNPLWQMAIEGYLGGARFGIIVDPAWEAEAIRIVRNIGGDRQNKARIIQGTKAARDADRSHCPTNSIVELMHFTHLTAADYLKVSYGGVVQVMDAEELKTTARGLTADGMASGNYTMWRCDLGETDLVFGKSARLRALQAKQLQLEQLHIAARDAEQGYRQALQLQEICQGVKPVRLHQLLLETLQVQRQLQEAERTLGNLDLADVEFLEQALADKRAEYLAQERQDRQLEQSLGSCLQQQKQLDSTLTELADLQGRHEAEKAEAAAAVAAIIPVLPRFDAESAMGEAERAAQQDGDDFAAVLLRHDQRLQMLERELFKIVQTHNQTAAGVDQLIYDTGFAELHSAAFFQYWVHLAGTIEALHNRLKNNVLVERHRQLRQLKDSFNTAFVTNLCHSIYQAINEGKNILEDLNRELEHHCFGSDQERFYFSMAWVPEYQEYWQFFKAIINIPDLGDGATLFELDLPARQAATRDRLLAMLLDEDEQTAHRELARISDYRNYRRYEIYKQPKDKEPIALSLYGTGSGGQLETPAYIIRAAAVTSAFRFNEGKAHLRFVMVDEAFSKMDETRSREVIRYLTESLGLQLIFIMPTSKSGPFLDMISNQFVFSKCPSQQPVGELKTRVLVDRKVCRQEQIARLWANHRQTIRHQAMLDFMDEFWEKA